MSEPGNKKARYAGLGLTFGAGIVAGFGIVLGDAVFGDVGMGLTLIAGTGAGIGLVFGAAYGARQTKNNDGKDSSV